jgi:WD40 repeat protein
LGSVLSLAFSPDGKLVAIGDSNGVVQLWEVANKQEIFTCKGHNGWVYVKRLGSLIAPKDEAV